jgi:hypothetical protein
MALLSGSGIRARSQAGFLKSPLGR